MNRPPVYQQTGAQAGNKRPKLDIWQKLTLLMIGITALFVAGIVFSKFWMELGHRDQIQQQLAQLRAEEAQLRQQRDRVKREYEWLRDDPGYREVFARDRLDLQKPGETIIQIERKPER